MEHEDENFPIFNRNRFKLVPTSALMAKFAEELGSTKKLLHFVITKSLNRITVV